MIALSTEELNASRSVWPRRRGSTETRLDELVRIFNKNLKPADLGLETQVVTRATAADLKMALRDPQTTALFWLSHASPTHLLGGLSAQGVIPDHEGVNVSSLFKKIHPNVKWVGLVGCYTNTIINEYKEEGFYKTNPSLQINGYDGIVFPSPGLSSSVWKAHSHLRSSKEKWPRLTCEEQQEDENDNKGFFLTVSRLDSEHRSDVLISINGHFLDFLTQAEENIEFWVPDSVPIRKIEVIQANLEINLPPLELLSIKSMYGSVKWKALSYRDAPLGKTRHLYQIPHTDDIVLMEKPSCLWE